LYTAIWRCTRGFQAKALIPEAVHRLLTKRLAMAPAGGKRRLTASADWKGGWAVDAMVDLAPLEHGC